MIKQKKIYLTKMFNQKECLLDNLYLVLFSIFVGYKFLETTTWTIPWMTNYFDVLKYIFIAFVIARLCFCKDFSKKEILFVIILVFVLLYAMNTNGYTEIGYMAMMVLGCRGLKSDRVIGTYFFVSLVLFLLTIAAALSGIIDNLVYYQGEDRVRMSLGIIYPTDFSAHVFFLTLCYIFLRRNYLKLIECFIPIVLAGVVYFIADARLNTICLLMFGIGLLFIVFYRRKLKNNSNWIMLLSDILSKILIMAPVLCAGLIINLTMVFSSDRWWTARINEILNNRLCYGREGMDLYGITLWGQYIEMMGNGSNTEAKPFYFFLDSSYVSSLLRYGLIVLILTLFIMVFISYKASVTQNIVLLWIMAMIAVQCIVEQHLIEVAYNPFLWLVLTNGQTSIKLVKDENQ